MSYERDYFEWLIGLVGARPMGIRNLCERLHKVVFRWTIRNDENRNEDGRDLKFRFSEQYSFFARTDKIHHEKGLVSVLEVLVALVIRMEVEVLGSSPDSTDIPLRFLELLTNIGMPKHIFGDRMGPIVGAKEELFRQNLNTFLDRTYDKNGYESLFPVGDPGTLVDMRNVEIWYQMMKYIEENLS